MEIEQQRGISISSTVMQFPYGDHILNLLDTPGHRDFSEDTYRVLAAVDAVVMVLDAAKGIESQTLKLFQVCRARSLPVITFLNKYDRPGREPLELLDEIEAQIGLRPTPVTWPVGSGAEFAGVIDRRTSEFTRFTRTARGASAALEETVPLDVAAKEDTAAWRAAVDEVGLLDAIGADVDIPSFLAGSSTPLFVGSGADQLRGAQAARRRRRHWRRRRRRVSISPALLGNLTRRSPHSSSRSRRTWTRRTATVSPSPGSARAASSGAWR